MVDISSFIKDLGSFHAKRDRLFRAYISSIDWKMSYGLYQDCEQTIKTIFSVLDNAYKLSNHKQFREAFALCRVGLESYLYLKVMCEAQYYYDRLWEVPSSQDFTSSLNKAKQDVANAKRRKGSKPVRVERFPKKNKDTRQFRVVFHDRYNACIVYWNAYHTFDSQVKFLDPKQTSIDADYIKDPSFMKRLKSRDAEDRINQSITHRIYFTFEAILDLLELNSITTKQKRQAVNTHYTFLGMFVHPTLKSETIVRQRSPELLSLLVSLYVCMIEFDIMLSFTKLTGRDKRYVNSTQPQEIIRAYRQLMRNHRYFWFLWNKPYKVDYYLKWGRMASRSNPPRHPLQLPVTKLNYRGDILQRLEDVFTPFIRLKQTPKGRRVAIRYNAPKL